MGTINIKQLTEDFEKECEYAKILQSGNRYAYMRYHYLKALQIAITFTEYYKNDNKNIKKYEAWKQLVDAIAKKIEIDYDYTEIKEIDAYKLFTKSVFEVHTNKATGTCFAVDFKDDDYYFITNKHVVTTSKTVTIISKDKTIYTEAIVVDTDDKYDIALLKAHIKSDNIVPVTFTEKKNLQEGVKIFIVGNSSGLGLGFAQGYISSFLDEKIMVSIKTEHGTSGAAFFDSYGSVIGLNVGILGEVSFCLNVDVVIDYMKKFKLKTRITPSLKYN